MTLASKVAERLNENFTADVCSQISYNPMKDIRYFVDIVYSHICASTNDNLLQYEQVLVFSKKVEQVIALALLYDTGKKKDAVITSCIEAVLSIKNSYLVHDFDFSISNNGSKLQNNKSYEEIYQAALCENDATPNNLFVQSIEFCMDTALILSQPESNIKSTISYTFTTRLQKEYNPIINTLALESFKQLSLPYSPNLPPFSLQISSVGEPIYMGVDFLFDLNNYWSKPGTLTNSDDSTFLPSLELVICVSFDHTDWVISGPLVQTVVIENEATCEKDSKNLFNGSLKSSFCIVPLRSGYILPPTFECYLHYDSLKDSGEDYFRNGSFASSSLSVGSESKSVSQNILPRSPLDTHEHNKNDVNIASKNPAQSIPDNSSSMDHESDVSDSPIDFPELGSDNRFFKLNTYHVNAGKPIVVLPSSSSINSFLVN
ncbi:hypothetical protein BB560_000143 [Smittium megazygosporum]|uniref:Uncharacterized protein n=1 Tax=Smittium megazygosporum TaxID=133381 RepID=A0A2T9ZL61_9FUNG|nr:hypothetical protein BB560_000143 [Smittium megazygosporum]